MSKNGPKMVKNCQNCPQIGEIIRGGSRKIPTNPKKYQKNGQKRSRGAVWKCTKKVKSAKIGKNYEKNRFSLQQLQKGHFLKEMHPQKNNNFAFGEKKSCFFFAPSPRHRCDPLGGGCSTGFWDSWILPLYLSLVDGKRSVYITFFFFGVHFLKEMAFFEKLLRENQFFS